MHLDCNRIHHGVTIHRLYRVADHQADGRGERILMLLCIAIIIVAYMLVCVGWSYIIDHGNQADNEDASDMY